MKTKAAIALGSFSAGLLAFAAAAYWSLDRQLRRRL